MSKKKLWIMLAAVAVLLVALFFLLRGCGEKPAAETAEELTEDTQKTESPLDAEKTEAETDPEENSTSAQLIESEGDLIITIPDDEESDGF